MMTNTGFWLCQLAGVAGPVEVAQSAPVEERVLHTTQQQSLLPMKEICGRNPRGIATRLPWLEERRLWSVQVGLQAGRKGKSCLQTVPFSEMQMNWGLF